MKSLLPFTAQDVASTLAILKIDKNKVKEKTFFSLQN